MDWYVTFGTYNKKVIMDLGDVIPIFINSDEGCIMLKLFDYIL